MSCELIQCELKNTAGEPVVITVRQLPASKALDLQIELVSLLGDRVFPFIEDTYNFGDMLRLLGTTKYKELSDLLKRVIVMATIDGKEISTATFDFHYSGEQMLAMEVFAFVCKANFQSFFKQGLEMNERKRLEAEEASMKERQKNSSPEKT